MFFSVSELEKYYELKIEIGGLQSFKSNAMSIYSGNEHEPNTIACIPNISSELQTGPKRKGVLFDVTLCWGAERDEPGELEISGLCRVLGRRATASLTANAPEER